MSEKYLWLKLDPENLTHFPEKITDSPPVFEPEFVVGERDVSFIKLTGDAFDIKTVENILFSSQKLSQQQKQEIATQVLRDLNTTIKAFYPKQTVLSVSMVLRAVQLTLERVQDPEGWGNRTFIEEDF